jgi:hypothetical protein
MAQPKTVKPKSSKMETAMSKNQRLILDYQHYAWHCILRTRRSMPIFKWAAALRMCPHEPAEPSFRRNFSGPINFTNAFSEQN